MDPIEVKDSVVPERVIPAIKLRPNFGFKINYNLQQNDVVELYAKVNGVNFGSLIKYTVEQPVDTGNVVVCAVNIGFVEQKEGFIPSINDQLNPPAPVIPEPVVPEPEG